MNMEHRQEVNPRLPSFDQKERRRVDPLVATVWSLGVVGAVCTVVGAITVIRWVAHLARGWLG